MDAHYNIEIEENENSVSVILLLLFKNVFCSNLNSHFTIFCSSILQSPMIKHREMKKA